MTKVDYPAVVRRRSKGYILSFPDLRAINLEGSSIFDLVEEAKLRLQHYVRNRLAKGEHVSLPGDIPPRNGGVGYVGTFKIEAEIPFEPVEVTVRLDPKVARAIDRTSPSRSEFIVQAIEAALEAERGTSTSHRRWWSVRSKIMTNRKSESDISKSSSAQQPQGGEAAGDSWKSDSQNDETTKPGQNAAANAKDSKILEKGVADGS